MIHLINFIRMRTSLHSPVTSPYREQQSGGKLSNKRGWCPSHQTLKDKVNIQTILTSRKIFNLLIGYSLKKKNTLRRECRRSQHSLRVYSGETSPGKNKTVAIVRDNSRSIIRWVFTRYLKMIPMTLGSVPNVNDSVFGELSVSDSVWSSPCR